ncbi:MAG TPA: hypothetical protein VF104_06290 [Burkholderiales bacterium]
MQDQRAMTIHFVDGTKVSFDFPEQKTNDAARSIMLEDLEKSPFLMVEAEGVLLIYPVANIKAIQILVPGGTKLAQVSRAIIRGATVMA